MPFRTIEISDPRFERDGLRQLTVKSPALGQRVDLSLFVPDALKKEQDIPIVILLHGVYGSHWAWALKGGAHQVARQLISSQEIRPMILAMPSDGLWGDGSGYVPHDQQDFEKWIIAEVPELIHQVLQFKSAAPLFIAGLSMGGYGALRLGAKYPSSFNGISALSSITNFSDWQSFMEERVDELSIPKEEQEVLTFLIKNKEQLPPFRFDCGTEDPLIDPNRKLHQALIQQNISHQYQEFPGGHEWPYWTLGLERSLKFFETVMKASDEPS